MVDWCKIGDAGVWANKVSTIEVTPNSSEIYSAFADHRQETIHAAANHLLHGTMSESTTIVENLKIRTYSFDGNLVAVWDSGEPSSTENYSAHKANFFQDWVTGRIWCVWAGTDYFKATYSDNDGLTWVSIVTLPIESHAFYSAGYFGGYAALFAAADDHLAYLDGAQVYVYDASGTLVRTHTAPTAYGAQPTDYVLAVIPIKSGGVALLGTKHNAYPAATELRHYLHTTTGAISSASLSWSTTQFLTVPVTGLNDASVGFIYSQGVETASSGVIVFTSEPTSTVDGFVRVLTLKPSGATATTIFSDDYDTYIDILWNMRPFPARCSGKDFIFLPVKDYHSYYYGWKMEVYESVTGSGVWEKNTALSEEISNYLGYEVDHYSLGVSANNGALFFYVGQYLYTGEWGVTHTIHKLQ